uniref:Uncharacterized protein n=1 Tax=viral metagenome TaxID=1070528 RepID=A0A6C0CGL8_9ZZZZ
MSFHNLQKMSPKFASAAVQLDMLPNGTKCPQCSAIASKDLKHSHNADNLPREYLDVYRLNEPVQFKGSESWKNSFSVFLKYLGDHDFLRFPLGYYGEDGYWVSYKCIRIGTNITPKPQKDEDAVLVLPAEFQCFPFNISSNSVVLKNDGTGWNVATLQFSNGIRHGVKRNGENEIDMFTDTTPVPLKTRDRIMLGIEQNFIPIQFISGPNTGKQDEVDIHFIRILTTLGAAIEAAGEDTEIADEVALMLGPISDHNKTAFKNLVELLVLGELLKDPLDNAHHWYSQILVAMARLYSPGRYSVRREREHEDVYRDKGLCNSLGYLAVDLAEAKVYGLMKIYSRHELTIDNVYLEFRKALVFGERSNDMHKRRGVALYVLKGTKDFEVEPYETAQRSVQLGSKFTGVVPVSWQGFEEQHALLTTKNGGLWKITHQTPNGRTFWYSGDNANGEELKPGDWRLLSTKDRLFFVSGTNQLLQLYWLDFLGNWNQQKCNEFTPIVCNWLRPNKILKITACEKLSKKCTAVDQQRGLALLKLAAHNDVAKETTSWLYDLINEVSLNQQDMIRFLKWTLVGQLENFCTPDEFKTLFKTE